MMSDRGRPPSEHWYVPMPSEKREEVGKKKVNDLQRQIKSIEDEMKDRHTLIHKLSRLQEVESSRREVDDRVIERNSATSSPRLLNEELERLYGSNTPSKLDRQSSPSNRRIVQTVIQHRTKEFSQKQQEAALQAKYLDKERRRLQEARERVQEQRRALLSSVPGAGQIEPRTIEPQGVDSYIQKTVETLPETVNKIWEMREGLEKHYLYYQKPYKGELGIRSYEQEQLKDYFVVRPVVEEIVEDFLNLYLPHDHLVEHETYKAIMDEEKKWVTKQSESLSEKKAVLLFAEGMIIDETGDMIQEVVKEMSHLYGSFRNITDNMVMTESEKISTGQDHERDQSDRFYNLVTKAYFSLKENRNRHRKEIWAHSQYVVNKMKKRAIKRKEGIILEEEPEEVEDEDEEDNDLDAPDLTILDFNTLTPTILKNLEPSSIDPPEVAQEKEYTQRYIRRELEYWSNIEPIVQTLDIAKQCRGVKIARASHNHRYLAVGTYHGDVIVYDATTIPWRPFQSLHNTAKTHDHIVDLAWSLDNTRLIVIDSTGKLQVLSVTYGQVGTEDPRKLELPEDDRGVIAQRLDNLLTLDVEQEDFIFQQGNLAEVKALDDPGLLPIRAAFFPSFTFLGTQNEMIVGLDNGDILKCNFETTLKNNDQQQQQEEQKEEDEDNTGDTGPTETPIIYKPSLVDHEEAANLNTIGQNIEAELLRGHKQAILHMTFVEHLNMLVTIDQKGFINRWKYNLRLRSTFGWFIPARKYKLETSKVMYKETGTDKPKVVFTDRPTPGRKPKTRQEIAAQRRRVQNTLDNMQLGSPWHEEFVEEEELVMQIFAPRGNIAQSGGMFHIVYKHEETEQLSTYITRLYKPVKVRCTKIVQVKSSPASTELIIILLFNKYPPKGAHFTVIIVDIVDMELRDVRKDIPLTDIDYNMMLKKKIISCDVSRVFGPTGSDYLFMMYKGNLRCISLTTGQTVVKVGDRENPEESFKGCVLDETDVEMPEDSEVSTLCVNGSIFCIAYARRCSKIFVVKFKDENFYRDRRAMWKSYTTLPKHRIIPVELRVDTHNWNLGDIQHTTVAIRKVLLGTIDREMRKAGLIRDHPKTIRNIALLDKVENYKVLDREVENSNLLEKEGVNDRRMASRQSLPQINPEDQEKF